MEDQSMILNRVVAELEELKDIILNNTGLENVLVNITLDYLTGLVESFIVENIRACQSHIDKLDNNYYQGLKDIKQNYINQPTKIGYPIFVDFLEQINAEYGKVSSLLFSYQSFLDQWRHNYLVDKESTKLKLYQWYQSLKFNPMAQYNGSGYFDLILFEEEDQDMIGLELPKLTRQVRRRERYPIDDNDLQI